MTAPVIEVRDLQTRLVTRWGTIRAVDGVSFSVAEGETLGLVGESGCGKSTTGRLLLRLLPASGGSVRFRGRELLGLSSHDMRAQLAEPRLLRRHAGP